MTTTATRSSTPTRTTTHKVSKTTQSSNLPRSPRVGDKAVIPRGAARGRTTTNDSRMLPYRVRHVAVVQLLALLAGDTSARTADAAIWLDAAWLELYAPDPAQADGTWASVMLTFEEAAACRNLIDGVTCDRSALSGARQRLDATSKRSTR